MKAIRIDAPGGPEVLVPVEIPTPAPGPGEALIRAEAIGVNYFDMLIRTGKYRWMPKLPFVPGNEFVGRIEALGEGTTQLKAGQRVFLAGYDIDNRGGLYAEFAVAPFAALWPLPDNVDAAAATALANYQLAHILLHHAARGVHPGTVVVLGAAGGVGSALVDSARLIGARVIGLAGSAEKCAFLHARGATSLDHRDPDLEAKLAEAIGSHGADIVFDHVAGPGLEAHLKRLAPLGMIVSYAVLGGVAPGDLFKAMRAHLEASPAVRCFTMHTYDHLPGPRREAMQSAVELLSRHRIAPAVARKFPLAEAAEAHRLMESRAAIGKIVLVP
jgi:NADPH2:quinone reductase